MRAVLHVPARLAPRVAYQLLIAYSTTAESFARCAQRLPGDPGADADAADAQTELESLRARLREIEHLLEPIGFDAECDEIQLVGACDLIEAALLDALGDSPSFIEEAIKNYRHGEGDLTDIAAAINETRGLIALLREVEVRAVVPTE
jgi:hypothetical protein